MFPDQASASTVEPFAERLARAREGDSEAMGKLFELQREHLLDQARRRIPAWLRRELAPSDAVQVTMMSAKRHFEQFRGDSPGEFTEWLYVTMYNTVCDFIRHAEGRRRQHAIRVISLEDVPEETLDAMSRDGRGSVCDDFSDEEKKESVLRCLALLPEHYRRVLRLRYHEQLGFEAVGKELDMSEEAARSLFRRAMKEITEMARAFRIVEDERPGTRR